ncbi:MAG: nuclear transport factor 2 family protein [Ginsengibacter sp.]
MNNIGNVTDKFYTAFSILDYKAMNSCYSADAVFSDPVFGILQGEEIKRMWEMLCKNARDFEVLFEHVKTDGEYVTYRWTAKYTFSKTGRKVVNNVTAYILVQNNLIVEHTDEFDFYKWSRQALGLPGLLFGWSSVIKNKVRKNAKKNLEVFMKNSKIKI